MTRFENGPAKGKTLMLKRAPVFLRVVQETTGDRDFDALNELEDEPTASERIFVYVLKGPVNWVFVDGTKCRGRFALALYKLVEPQPDDSTLRHKSKWIEWVGAQTPPDWYRANNELGRSA